jgi:HEPN domain-containing protein
VGVESMQSHEVSLLIAHDDLKAAQVLYQEGLYTTAIFHVQQCVEKSLKAYLAYKQQPLTKTHDLIILVKDSVKFNPSFIQFLPLAQELKPYATKGRYADDYITLEQPFLHAVIKETAVLFEFVQQKICL